MAFVGGIGEVLGFEAEAVTVFIDLTALSDVGTVKKITGIELYSRFCCVDFHYPSGCRLIYSNCVV